LNDTIQNFMFLEMIWNLIQDKKQKMDICINALKDFDQLISLPGFQMYKNQWVDTVVEKILKEDHTELYVNYHLLQKLISSYPRISITADLSQDNLLEHIESKIQRKLLFFIFEEYERFKKTVESIIKKESIDTSTLDSRVILGRFNYLDEISARLMILENLYKLSFFSNEKQWDDSFIRILNLSVINSFTKKEKECASQWLLNLNLRHSIHFSAASYLFEKLQSLPPSLMDSTTFSCFQTYFIYVNSFLDLMSSSYQNQPNPKQTFLVKSIQIYI